MFSLAAFLAPGFGPTIWKGGGGQGLLTDRSCHEKKREKLPGGGEASPLFLALHLSSRYIQLPLATGCRNRFRKNEIVWEDESSLTHSVLRNREWQLFLPRSVPCRRPSLAPAAGDWLVTSLRTQAAEEQKNAIGFPEEKEIYIRNSEEGLQKEKHATSSNALLLLRGKLS